MTIKEIFEKAENGTLTYDQFEATMKTNGAKFADLSEGKYVSKNKYEDDLKDKDKQIGTLTQTLNDRDTDLAGLKTQLENAGNDANKLADLNSQLATLQGKYDTDTKNYQTQLSKQAYEFAVKDYASTKSFSSQAAKRDFINSMIAKNLQMDNNMIIGADDFTTMYTANNADAFIVAKQEETPSVQQEVPHFVQPSGNPNGETVSDSPFDFSFMGVRPRK